MVDNPSAFQKLAEEKAHQLNIVMAMGVLGIVMANMAINSAFDATSWVGRRWWERKV